jgi:hypothetical protein
MWEACSDFLVLYSSPASPLWSPVSATPENMYQFQDFILPYPPASMAAEIMYQYHRSFLFFPFSMFLR